MAGIPGPPCRKSKTGSEESFWSVQPCKKDFDFELDLYEQTPKGEYVQLTSYWTRASYGS